MLEVSYYNVGNALTWKLFLGHCKEVKRGSLGHRMCHGMLAFAEVAPLIGQLCSLFELAIVRAKAKNRTKELPDLTQKKVTPEKEIKQNEKDKVKSSAEGLTKENQNKKPEDATGKPPADESKKPLPVWTPKTTPKTKAEKSNAKLPAFLNGTGKDIEGRTLKAIWNLSDEEKLRKGDYIPWLFPSRTGTKGYDKAPELNLDADLIKYLRQEPVIVGSVRKSFDVMLKLYGMQYDPTLKKVERTKDFEKSAKYWTTESYGNFQRITRILGCLVNFELKDEANAFLLQLKEIRDKKPKGLQDPKAFAKSYDLWNKKLSEEPQK